MTTNNLARRIDKLGGNSRHIYDGRSITIIDDGTDETAKRIDELQAKAEAEGRGIIQFWLVSDDGKERTRYSVATTGDRRY